MENDLLFVIGPSGSGIRTTIAIVEDLHEFAAVTKVDPRTLVSLVQMMPQLNQTRWKKLAVHVGMRRMAARDLEQDSFIADSLDAFRKLKTERRRFKIIFLYCSQAQLQRRQDYGFHPLRAACGSMPAAIFKECEVMVQLFLLLSEEFKDELVFIDTSHPKPHGIQTVKDGLDRALKEDKHAKGANDDQLLQTLCTQGWNEMRTTLGHVREMIALIDREYLAEKEVGEKDRLNCLLLGESGTGKETIAKIMHDKSSAGKNKKPFVVIDCTAIPEGLIESELFGSVEGAFTGAINRMGRVKSANGGVIFIDEIGLANKTFQAKLLRLIEEREYRKVGEDGSPQRVDCRIIAATSRNLEEEVKNGNFLLDLYQRLDGVSIVIPSLRERREDIPKLLKRYLREKRFSPEAMAVLFDYEWPGNARELRNVVQRCSLVAAKEVRLSDLPPKITERYSGIVEYREHVKNQSHAIDMNPSFDPNRVTLEAIKEHIRSGDREWLEKTTREARRQVILEALEKSGGNVTKVADELRVLRPQLYRWMDDCGIRVPEGSNEIEPE
jgi:DNA-binding NtrC family response regulator